VVRAVAIAHRPDMLGQVVSAIRRAGGFIGAVDFVAVSEGKLLRDSTVDAAGPPWCLASVSAWPDGRPRSAVMGR
jgi:hypothetical protein